MLLRDFIKKSQIETNENDIILLEDFFGINVSTSRPQLKRGEHHAFN